MALRTIVKEIESGVEFELEKLADNEVEAIGQVCETIANGYRTLAGCALLLNADSDRYYHLLAHAAAARKYFLERCQTEKPDFRDAYRAAGNSQPLFSALAARHFALAERIAALSSRVWWEGEEYAEDFYYAHALHLLLIQNPPNGAALAAALKGLKEELDDNTMARYLVCLGLANRDQSIFDDAFDELLAMRKEEVSEMTEPFTPYDSAEQRVAKSYFTEGLALLNLADKLGLTTKPAYHYCPALTRLPMRKPFPSPPPPL